MLRRHRAWAPLAPTPSARLPAMILDRRAFDSIPYSHIVNCYDGRRPDSPGHPGQSCQSLPSYPSAILSAGLFPLNSLQSFPGERSPVGTYQHWAFIPRPNVVPDQNMLLVCSSRSIHSPTFLRHFKGTSGPLGQPMGGTQAQSPHGYPYTEWWNPRVQRARGAKHPGTYPIFLGNYNIY